MNSYIALLRGINVGGKNVVKMEHLRQSFADMGFSDIETYIQSDNIIFKTSEQDKNKLTEQIEGYLQKHFPSKVRTLVLHADDLAEAIEGAPSDFGAEPDKFRYDVWFLLPPTTAKDITSKIDPREGVDQLYTGRHAIYTSRLTSSMGKSHFSKIMQTPLSDCFTIRNWNTTKKLLEIVTSGLDSGGEE
ncbi:MAG: DUF1697 domain-containing protein [Candidatus Saccharimonadales bacterium]